MLQDPGEQQAVSASEQERRRPLVFVTVGTDHHPFDRLVRWIDSWAGSHPETEVIVQYGTSTSPRNAIGHRELGHTEMLDLFRAANVVVTQGGPGGIMDSRRYGLLPIVVPRNPAAGEHIDDHQMLFAEHMRRQQKVVVAVGQDDLEAMIDQALSRPDDFATTPGGSPTSATAAAIGAALDSLVHGRPSRWRHLRR